MVVTKLAAMARFSGYMEVIEEEFSPIDDVSFGENSSFGI